MAAAFATLGLATMLVLLYAFVDALAAHDRRKPPEPPEDYQQHVLRREQWLRDQQRKREADYKQERRRRWWALLWADPVALGLWRVWCAGSPLWCLYRLWWQFGNCHIGTFSGLHRLACPAAVPVGVGGLLLTPPIFLAATCLAVYSIVRGFRPHKSASAGVGRLVSPAPRFLTTH